MHGNKVDGGARSCPLEIDPAAVSAGGAVLKYYVELAAELRAKVGGLPAGQSWVGRPGMPDVMRRIELVRGALGPEVGDSASLEAVRDKWRGDVARSRTREGVADLVDAGVCERAAGRREAVPHPEPGAIRYVAACILTAAGGHRHCGPAVVDLALEQVLAVGDPAARIEAGVGGWYALAGSGCRCGGCLDGGVVWQLMQDDDVMVLGRALPWDPDEDPSISIASLDGRPLVDMEDVTEDECGKAMACALGFRDAGELRAWALQNPDIWGNEYGDLMFDLDVAYGVSGGGPLTISHVFRHWLGVAGRVDAAGLGTGREACMMGLEDPVKVKVRWDDGLVVPLDDWAREAGWWGAEAQETAALARAVAGVGDRGPF